MTVNHNLTDALRRTARTLQEELEKSVLATQILGEQKKISDLKMLIVVCRVFHGYNTVFYVTARDTGHCDGRFETVGQGVGKC